MEPKNKGKNMLRKVKDKLIGKNSTTSETDFEEVIENSTEMDKEIIQQEDVVEKKDPVRRYYKSLKEPKRVDNFYKKLAIDIKDLEEREEMLYRILQQHADKGDVVEYVKTLSELSNTKSKISAKKMRLKR